MTALGALPGGGRTNSAEAISADAKVIVGFGGSSSFQAFRWRDGSAIALGTLDPQNPGSTALGVSADGNVIVGQGSGRDADGAGEASIWFPNRGLLNLRQYLLVHGVTAVQNWLLVDSLNAGASFGARGGDLRGSGGGWAARIISNLLIMQVPGAF